MLAEAQYAAFFLLRLHSAAAAPEVETQETESRRSVLPFAVCDVLRHIVHGSVWAGEGAVEVFYFYTLRRLPLAKAIESCRGVGNTRL